MRRSFSHSIPSLLVLASALLVALSSTAPLAAEEIALTYDVITLEEHGDQVHVRVSLTALNKGEGELANVNARADGGALLAEGVVQFASIPAGEARSADATIVARAAQWENDKNIALRVEFEDASGLAHERHLHARGEEEGS